MQNGNAPCRWKKSPYMSMRIISTKRKKRTTQNRRRERAHGPEFWRNFSALCCKAIQKGVYTDDFIADLINKE